MSKESPGQRAVRESGHKDVSREAHTHIHHNAVPKERSPIDVPEVHRGAKGIDVTRAGEKEKDYAQTKAEARDWTTGSTK